MRIVAIRGRNLASLEGNFAIELEQAPLDRVGLFAITGPTGAGKSTLLDAICLALFDQMPRLPRGRGAAVGRDEDPNRFMNNDVRSILRRGSSEGYAEVDFIGTDGCRYRARWQVRRARGRASGRLQAQELSLIDLRTQQVLGRTKGEVLELIAERLGLTFEQFRRSVLLAQGDFAAFLKAEVKQRSDLLERITGTEIYSELSIAAHRRAGEEKAALDELEQRLTGIKPLDEAARMELEQQRAAQQQLRDQAELARQAAQRVLDWQQRLAELVQQEHAAAAALATAQQQLAAAEPRRQALQDVERAQPLRSLVETLDRTAADHDTARRGLEQALLTANRAQERWHVAQRNQQASQATLRAASARLDQVRPELQQARIVDQQVADAQGHYDKQRRESEAAAAAQRRADQRWQDLQAQCAQLQQQHAETAAWLTQRAHLSELASQWARWDSEFARYGQAADEARRTRQTLKQLDAQIDEQDTRWVQISEQLAAAQQATDTAQHALKALESTLQPDALGALRQQRTAREDRRQRLQNLLTLVREAGAKTQELAQIRTTLAEAQQQVESAHREAAATAEEHAQRQSALNEAERAFQLALTAQNKNAQALRALLQNGQPCPVCGATEHPWVGDASPVAHWVQEQEQRVGDLKRQVHELAMVRGRLENSGDNARRQALESARRADALSAELATLHQRWAQRPLDEALPDALPAPGLAEEIQSRLAAVEAELTQIREAERQAVEFQHRLGQARATFDASREQRDGLLQTGNELQQALNRFKVERTAQQTNLERAEQNARESQERLAAPLAGLPNWQAELGADPPALRRRCERAARQWLQRREKLDDAAKRLQETQSDFKAAEVEARNAAAFATVAQAELHRQHQTLQTLSRQRAALLGGRPADAVEQELNLAEQQARTADEQAHRELEDAHGVHAAAVNRVAHCQEEVDLRCAAHTLARNRLDADLAAQGTELDTIRRQLQHDAAWLESERTALNGLTVNCERAQALLEERCRQRETHQAVAPSEQTSEVAQAQLEQAQAGSEAAHNAVAELGARLRQDDTHRAQAAQWQQDYAAQRQCWELWNRLKDLIGSADGSKFRTYAQSLTLDVLLRYANRHLEDLARRYRLERAPGSDMELQVIDHEMGDEVRSIHSLSGGESFLVALALALGLASLSSHRTQVESLFIDEGFGSLDPDTLDMTIASLDALQSLGRKVGVISHVPAMVERIGVQVRVESRGGGKSVVKVMEASTHEILAAPGQY